MQEKKLTEKEQAEFQFKLEDELGFLNSPERISKTMWKHYFKNPDIKRTNYSGDIRKFDPCVGCFRGKVGLCKPSGCLRQLADCMRSWAKEMKESGLDPNSMDENNETIMYHLLFRRNTYPMKVFFETFGIDINTESYRGKVNLKQRYEFDFEWEINTWNNLYDTFNKIKEARKNVTSL